MKAARRPARKRLAKGAAEGVPGQAAGSADERVLVEAAQRDPAEFEALYELNFERVYAFVAGRVRDRATAEDVTSEVFHKALANLPRYEWRGIPFAAWLLRIAANAIADQFKRTAREFPSPDDPPGAASGGSEAGGVRTICGAAEHTGDCQAAREDLRSHQATAIARGAEFAGADG